MAISADSGHSAASYRYRGSITPRAHLLEKVGSRCKHTKRDALFLVKQDEQQAGQAQQEGIEQQSALPPLYLAVSNIGVLFILWFGGKNVLGHDPELWNDTVAANVLCGQDGDAMTYADFSGLPFAPAGAL